MNKIFASFLPPNKSAGIENKKIEKNSPVHIPQSVDTRDFYISKNKKQNNNKMIIGIGVGLAALIVGLYVKFRKGKAQPVNDTITQLINELKPNDEKLAREFYPILNDNAIKLGLKTENFKTNRSMLKS